MKTEVRVLVGIGLALLVGAAVYWFTSYEDGGTTMLLLSAVLALMIGGYLHLEGRRLPDPGPEGPVASIEEAYLPHASVWPLGIGFGLVLVANGLALGAWALIPGAMLTAGSVYGYARQSRRRD